MCIAWLPVRRWCLGIVAPSAHSTWRWSIRKFARDRTSPDWAWLGPRSKGVSVRQSLAVWLGRKQSRAAFERGVEQSDVGTQAWVFLAVF